jgi:hypothetical protein
MKEFAVTFVNRVFASRFLALFSLGVLALIPVHVAQSQTANSSSICPVTQAPQPPFTPTGVERQQRSGFYFGTPKLSILLVGSWYEQMNKIVWLSDDVRFPRQVDLKVTGRRLDGDAPPPKFEGPHVARALDPSGQPKPGHDFITSSIKFPAPGCWEITAQMNGTKLTFVTDVLPGPQR